MKHFKLMHTTTSRLTVLGIFEKDIAEKSKFQTLLKL